MSITKPTKIEATKAAESFILYGDKTKAFRAAFPKSKAKKESMNVLAIKLHSSVKVQLMIQTLRSEMEVVVVDGAEFSIESKKRLLISTAMYGVEQEVIAKPKWMKDEDYDPEFKQRNPQATVSAVKELNLMDGDHAAKEFKVEQTSLEEYRNRLGR